VRNKGEASHVTGSEGWYEVFVERMLYISDWRINYNHLFQISKIRTKTETLEGRKL
jgi:hypothetical protein